MNSTIVNLTKLPKSIARTFQRQNRASLWIKAKKSFGNYKIVKPGKVYPTLEVPRHITLPSYALSGQPLQGPKEPEIKTENQVDKLRKSCILAANILNEVGKSIKIGTTTNDIDIMVHSLSIQNGAYPSPLNYNGFPKSVCTSVNNVACHGIPDDRPLEDGDIVNVDVTVYLNGYHGDCSKTFEVGNVDEQGRKLVSATQQCLEKAISICRHGQLFTAIGYYIQQEAEKLGFKVVPAFIGHGIGEYFHGPPDIYHFLNDYPGEMKTGMTFTIEPILSQGTEEIEIQEDNWTAITVDDSRTAQFEHTILITGDKAEILTVPEET